MEKKSVFSYGCLTFAITVIVLAAIIIFVSFSQSRGTEIRAIGENVQSAETHIYDDAEIITLMSGSGTEVVGKCSVVKAASSDVTEAALTDWYFNHVEPGGYNYAIIAYTDKPNFGVYGNKGIVEKDVGLHSEKDGSYSMGSDNNAVIYAAADGKLVELTDN